MQKVRLGVLKGITNCPGLNIWLREGPVIQYSGLRGHKRSARGGIQYGLTGMGRRGHEPG